MIPFDASNPTLSLTLAIEECRREKKKELILPRGTYTLTPDHAPSRPMSISNHDTYGYTSVGLLLEDMEDFVLDGNGSTVIADGVMVTVGILRCANVTVKNLTLKALHTMRGEAVVTAHHEDGFEVRFTNDIDYVLRDGWVYYRDPYGHEDRHHYYMIIGREGEEGRYLPETRETFRTDFTFEEVGERTLRLHNPPFVPEIGMRLIMAPGDRHGCTLFVEDSKNVQIEDVTVTSSYGMGLLAQISENVIVERMRIEPEEGTTYSTANDATHFVNCRGSVVVRDSFFDGMLDDALNVHGLYARIDRVDPTGLLVRDMHPGAKGQAIYRKGDQVAVMDKKLLIPTKTMTVSEVVPINADVTYLKVVESTEGVLPDMTLEELCGSPEVLFENNTVQHNRARGILLAGKKKTVIRNNLFRSPGASIMFESNGDYWYESGGVCDVLIEENTFESCGICLHAWGKSVITGSPRKEFDGKNYYHGTIAVERNRFIGCPRSLSRLANVKRVIFRDNEIDEILSPNVYTDCMTVEDDTL